MPKLARKNLIINSSSLLCVAALPACGAVILARTLDLCRYTNSRRHLKGVDSKHRLARFNYCSSAHLSFLQDWLLLKSTLSFVPPCQAVMLRRVLPTGSLKYSFGTFPLAYSTPFVSAQVNEQTHPDLAASTFVRRFYFYFIFAYILFKDGIIHFRVAR